MSQVSDVSLVLKCVVFNNTRAFESLVEKYQSPIRRLFLHLTLGDRQLSDDLAQETFLKAYTNISSFRNLSKFSTWLYRIAYNVYHDYLRSKKTTSELEDFKLEPSSHSSQPDLGLSMDVMRGLAQLNPKERACISLFFIEDRPIEQISAITLIPTNTVKSHIKRGKEKLREFLTSNGYDK